MPLGLRLRQLRVNCWINLRWHGNKSSSQRSVTGQLGKGEGARYNSERHVKEFCPTVILFIIPGWMLETLGGRFYRWIKGSTSR